MLEKYGMALGQAASAAPIVSDENIQRLSSLSDALGEFENRINTAKATLPPSLPRLLNRCYR